MDRRRAVGLVLAGGVGAAAALSWSLWIWAAFGAPQDVADRAGPVTAGGLVETERWHPGRSGMN